MTTAEVAVQADAASRPHSRGEEALAGAIAGAGTGPAGETEHGHAAGHGEEAKGNPTQLPGRGRGHPRLEAEHECYNVGHRLL